MGVLSSYVKWLFSSLGMEEEFCFKRMDCCADGGSEQRADGEEQADVKKPTDSMLSGDAEREENTGSGSHNSSCMDGWMDRKNYD